MFPAVIQNLGETGQPLESKYRQATCLWFVPVVHHCGACVQTSMYSLHALIHWCTQAHPQIFTHTLVHTHMHSPTNTHTFTCTHTHLHTHTHTLTYYVGTSRRCMHTHAHTQACTYTHPPTHTHTHTLTHSLTHSLSLFIPSLNRDAFLWEIQRHFPSAKLYYPACCCCLTLAKFL